MVFSNKILEGSTSLLKTHPFRNYRPSVQLIFSGAKLPTFVILISQPSVLGSRDSIACLYSNSAPLSLG